MCHVTGCHTGNKSKCQVPNDNALFVPDALLIVNLTVTGNSIQVCYDLGSSSSANRNCHQQFVCPLLILASDSNGYICDGGTDEGSPLLNP